MKNTLLLLAAFLIGCSSSEPSKNTSRKITWAEYQKMDAEQKDDPYVLDNLDDEAKKNLAGKGRKPK